MSLGKVIDIGLHLVSVKVRHKDAADTFLRFGWRNYILTRYALERLCDVDDFSLKVKIRRSQCKHFAKSQTAPIERFKSIIGSGLVLNSIHLYTCNSWQKTTLKMKIFKKSLFWHHPVMLAMAKGASASLLQISLRIDVGIAPVLASSRLWHEPVLPLLASTFLRITYQFPLVLF